MVFSKTGLRNIQAVRLNIDINYKRWSCYFPHNVLHHCFLTMELLLVCTSFNPWIIYCPLKKKKPPKNTLQKTNPPKTPRKYHYNWKAIETQSSISFILRNKRSLNYCTERSPQRCLFGVSLQPLEFHALIHIVDCLGRMKNYLSWGYLVFYTEIWISPQVTPRYKEHKNMLWSTDSAIKN